MCCQYVMFYSLAHLATLFNFREQIGDLSGGSVFTVFIPVICLIVCFVFIS